MTEKTTKARKPRKAQEKSLPMSYSTQYYGQGNVLIDGQAIARNNRTYWKMYRMSMEVMRCVHEISETCMKSGYKTMQVLSDGREKEVKVEGFEAAIRGSGGMRRIKSEIIKHLSIFGNAYLLKRRNVRYPMKYDVLDTRCVTVFADIHLDPVRYQYRPPYNSGGIEDFATDDIVHIRNSNDLDNPLCGISMLETLVLDVIGGEEASMSNFFFFANDNIPSALFILKEGLTKEQQKEVYENIKETFQGGHNKHKNLVSGAVTDVKPIRNEHTDASFLGQRMFTRDQVCAAFGVPKSILGFVEDVNRANSESQYSKFIDNTIRPWERLLEEIFTGLLSDFGDRYVFRIVDEHIDDLKDRSALAIQNVSNGIWSRNEAREYLGYEKADEELADELTVPTTQRLLVDLASATPDPGPDPETLPPQV